MVKFTCPYCDYTMQTAQYINGKGLCLKCQAVVADKVNHPLNPEWVKKMKTKFDRLNTDGAANKNGYGTLDFDEMSALLLKGNADLTDSELREVFDGADSNGNGVIEFTEFLWFLYGAPSSGGAGAGGGGGGGRGGRGGCQASPSGSRGAPRGNRHDGGPGASGLRPSDACETESGECPRNDGGPHHFKFGACSFCRAPELATAKSRGTFSSAGTGCSKGGKCLYKFGKCSKCGQKEY